MAQQPSHIVVIGAGIIGAAIAYQLAHRGARVTILDADEPGRGTSAVSFAWINSRGKEPRHYHDLNRRSLDMWDRFARGCGAVDALTWGGELRWAATPAGAEQMMAQVEALQSWGYPIYSVDAEGLRQMEPGLKTGPVTAASHGIIDGHADVERVVHACLDQAQRLGATLHAHTPAIGLQMGDVGDARTVQAVVTAGGRVACDAVVVACGADTPAVAAHAGLSVPMYHTFGASILTDPSPPLFQTVAVIHTARDADPLLHFRQLPDGRAIIQGATHGGVQRVWLPSHVPCPENRAARQSQGSTGRNDAEIQTMWEAAANFLPALDKAVISEVRRGRRPIPEDGLPILGFTHSVTNLYLAAMHSGVTLAALIGEFAALEIMSGLRIDLLEPYRLERFSSGSQASASSTMPEPRGKDVHDV